MKITEYPFLTRTFKKVYKGYLEDSGGDPYVGLNLVDTFLKRYPYYTEALVFKARMLIAIGKHKEAFKFIKIAKRIDEWNKCYIFDEAELLYKNDGKIAIDNLLKQIEDLVSQINNGIHNFLLSIDAEHREQIENELNKKIALLCCEKSKGVRP